PSGRTFNANTTYARMFGDISGTVNATLSVTDTTGLLGLPADAVVVNGVPSGNVTPLKQRNSTVGAHLGTAFNGVVGGGW
ncbi:hypothetical protein C1X77_27610, partial [Pseudomonas sp. GW531-E2]|uniref:hypothetical protein n=1 Tax=Pseudomonas sp. GW531-E2 TaxID=2070679 RepID=UPI000CA9967D